ncbi:MAG: hypothetical protein JW776_04395 [Candidatus Lokiarchaeota archaeon]|nr:hypothetical protein [Candidatus Lokiarchaeota archaeon]
MTVSNNEDSGQSNEDNSYVIIANNGGYTSPLSICEHVIVDNPEGSVIP